MPQETIESGEALKQQKFEDARYCYIATKDGNGYIVLEPFSTTIVITNEFLAIGNSIGGTIHTRVGTAALGVGHISTMLGPSYMGRLSVPLHNPTNKPICLKVGDQFLSIIFHRLKTRIKESNHTSKSHIEKFTKWGIKLTDEFINSFLVSSSISEINFPNKHHNRECKNVVLPKPFSPVMRNMFLPSFSLNLIVFSP